MSTIKAVLVDDEPYATGSTEIQLKKLAPEIEITGIFNDPAEALAFLKENETDLLLLDIEMPGINGFELLAALGKNTPDVIFTTAYESYALQALRHFAFAYLLKPVDDDELKEVLTRWKENRIRPSSAAAKVEDLLGLISRLQDKNSPIILSMSEGYELVQAGDIIRLESEGNYTHVIKQDGQLLVSKTLLEFEKLLTAYGFLRVHNSHLINPAFIRKFIKADGGSLVMSDKKEVPVSRNRKEEIQQYLERLPKI